MTIPKSIKIGGKWYKVVKTDKMKLGSVNYSAEIDYDEQVIRIVPGPKGNTEANLLHEIIHGILSHLGYSEHDEHLVKGLANAIYMVISDNPGMFEEINK